MRFSIRLIATLALSLTVSEIRLLIKLCITNCGQTAANGDILIIDSR